MRKALDYLLGFSVGLTITFVFVLLAYGTHMQDASFNDRANKEIQKARFYRGQTYGDY